MGLTLHKDMRGELFFGLILLLLLLLVSEVEIVVPALVLLNFGLFERWWDLLELGVLSVSVEGDEVVLDELESNQGETFEIQGLVSD